MLIVGGGRREGLAFQAGQVEGGQFLPVAGDEGRLQAGRRRFGLGQGRLGRGFLAGQGRFLLFPIRQGPAPEQGIADFLRLCQPFLAFTPDRGPLLILGRRRATGLGQECGQLLLFRPGVGGKPGLGLEFRFLLAYFRLEGQGQVVLLLPGLEFPVARPGQERGASQFGLLDRP